MSAAVVVSSRGTHYNILLDPPANEKGCKLSRKEEGFPSFSQVCLLYFLFFEIKKHTLFMLIIHLIESVVFGENPGGKK